MENKESFNNRLKPYFAPNDHLDIQLAYIMAKFGHRAQFRKEMVDDKPLRYFEHVRRVALIIMDELNIMDKTMIICAISHDLLEDSEFSPELIQRCFGEECCKIIGLLSKVPKEGYHERLAKCHDWRVLAIKMCDRLDNLRSLMAPGTTTEFHKKQIKETSEVYYQLFDYLLTICPKHYYKDMLKVRDEIKCLIEKYRILIDLKEQNEKS